MRRLTPLGISPGRTATIAALLVLVALGLRIFDLGGKSFWVDEGATFANGSASVSEIIDGQDNHPPGYYLIVHAVLNLDDGEAALRLPSALASAASVLMLFVIARRLFNDEVAVIASAILALSPLDIWYAQEARQPAVTGLLVLVAAFGLIRGGRPGYALAVVASIFGLFIDYSFVVGWTVFAATWIFWSWRERRNLIAPLVVVTSVAAAVFTPILGARFWRGFDDLLALDTPGTWYEPVLGSNPVTSNPAGLVLTMFAVVLVTNLGFRYWLEARPATAWVDYALVAGYGAVAMLLAIPRAYSVKKVVLLGWPLVALALAYLIATRIAPQWRSLTLIAVLAASVVGAGLTLAVPKANWREAVAIINAEAVNGDIAWIEPEPWAMGVYDYYDGQLPVFQSTDPGSVVEDIDGTVWLVTRRRPQDRAPSLAAEEWFDENLQLMSERDLYRLSVRRYSQ